jgi:hypothetical protein
MLLLEDDNASLSCPPSEPVVITSPSTGFCTQIPLPITNGIEGRVDEIVTMMPTLNDVDEPPEGRRVLPLAYSTLPAEDDATGATSNNNYFNALKNVGD